jgi:hypothetical protein
MVASTEEYESLVAKEVLDLVDRPPLSLFFRGNGQLKSNVMKW